MASHLMNKGLVGVDGEWDDEAGGFRIASFLEGSLARSAGVRVGDLLVAINGIALGDDEQTKADNGNRKPGSDASIIVERSGRKHEMNVTLVGMTEEQIARYVGYHMLDHVEIAQAD
jgi:C-terminal processing protease CtpA/Prc